MSAAKKVAVIDYPVGQKGVLFASERYVERASDPQPKLYITLYPPNNKPKMYENCKVLSGLMPELEFKGTPVYEVCGVIMRGKAVHVTSTTLPYTIEVLTDVVH